MGGGSSKSSSTQASTQTTTSGSATGTVGSVYQGQTVNVTEQIPEALIDLFKGLIDLSTTAVNAGVEAGGAAISSLSDIKTTAISPDTSTTKLLSPAVIVLAVGFLAFAYMMKGK